MRPVLSASPNAPIHAAMQADAMLETGDMEGRAVRLRVWKAVTELLIAERPPGAKVH